MVFHQSRVTCQGPLLIPQHPNLCVLSPPSFLLIQCREQTKTNWWLGVVDFCHCYNIMMQKIHLQQKYHFHICYWKCWYMNAIKINTALVQYIVLCLYYGTTCFLDIYYQTPPWRGKVTENVLMDSPTLHCVRNCGVQHECKHNHPKLKGLNYILVFSSLFFMQLSSCCVICGWL